MSNQNYSLHYNRPLIIAHISDIKQIAVNAPETLCSNAVWPEYIARDLFMFNGHIFVSCVLS